MKCKYCQAELEEDVTICPVCGKEQEETTPKVAPAEQKPEVAEIKEGIKATPGKIALAIAAGVVVLALLVAMVVSGIDGDLFRKTEDTVLSEEATVSVKETEAAETVTEGTIPPDGNPEDVTCKGSYTVSDEEIEAAMDTVVAVIGDKELTVADLQIYYWEYVYAIQSQIGDSAIILGLDFTQPLDTQLCEMGDVSMTWQQYFLQYALKSWHQYQAIVMAGKDAGYTLDALRQEELDSLPAQIDDMVASGGFEDRAAWIRDYIGPGCTVEDFLEYLADYYYADGYLENLYNTMEVTAEEVDAYFTENEGSYADSGVTKDAGKVVDVRHILLMPENGTTGDDGYPVYSDEDWAACEAEVQKIYDEWMAGDMSEESFAEYAVEYSQDGNAAQGGIYEGVMQGYMVETFDSWCFDEARQPGDHGLVKTQYGYHIMYFVASEETWYAAAESDLINDKVAAVIPAAMEAYLMTVDYGSIKLGSVDLSSY